MKSENLFDQYFANGKISLKLQKTAVLTSYLTTTLHVFLKLYQ
jgi:hypothetical protein